VGTQRETAAETPPKTARLAPQHVAKPRLRQALTCVGNVRPTRWSDVAGVRAGGGWRRRIAPHRRVASLRWWAGRRQWRGSPIGRRACTIARPSTSTAHFMLTA